MSLKKSSQVTTVAPLAQAIAGKDPATNGKHFFKSSSQMSTTNTAVINAANTACTLSYVSAGTTLQHVISGITVSLAGGTVGTLAAAVGTLTGSSSTAPSDGDTVVINGKTYTFKTTLAVSPGVEGQVLIGTTGSTDAAYLNLSKAILGTGTQGTNYWVATKSLDVSSAPSGHNLVVTALVPGAQGNAITTTAAGSAPGSWGGATLASGAGAMLQIKDGANLVFNASITAAGQQQFMFDPPLKGAANSALTITCSAAGSGVLTCINALHWTE